ncbi:hypothetical protein BT63DRAFT_28936 [Microthyrium microscopicum]|uniref:Uncharacterized protein n=1 Tax=Microthyrium microscopicum TaxID=703497 RepID=A0A6A6UTM0_9PEZI|nr:hypothetical protein BT63DRAFT_28936 [Microthyrium microscopicum]
MLFTSFLATGLALSSLANALPAVLDQRDDTHQAPHLDVPHIHNKNTNHSQADGSCHSRHHNGTALQSGHALHNGTTIHNGTALHNGTSVHGHHNGTTPSSVSGAQFSLAVPSTLSTQVQGRTPLSAYTSNGVLIIQTVVTVTPSAAAVETSAAVAATTAPAVEPAATSAPAAPASSATPAPMVASVAAPVPVPSVVAPAPVVSSAAPVASVAPAPSAAAPVSSAAPVAPAAPAAVASPAPAAGAGGLTAAQLLIAMPGSSTCSGKPTGCLTNTIAAPLLASGFSKYGLNSKGAQAAALAIISFESNDMEYDTNLVNTGTQGTFNQMTAKFITLYANALYGSSAKSAVADQIAQINDNKADSLGSAAWYMSTQCPDTVKSFASASGSAADAVYSTYITSCVGTTMTDGRMAAWTKAKTALGV